MNEQERFDKTEKIIADIKSGKRLPTLRELSEVGLSERHLANHPDCGNYFRGRAVDKRLRDSERGVE